MKTPSKMHQMTVKTAFFKFNTVGIALAEKYGPPNFSTMDDACQYMIQEIIKIPEKEWANRYPPGLVVSVAGEPLFLVAVINGDERISPLMAEFIRTFVGPQALETPLPIH